MKMKKRNKSRLLIYLSVCLIFFGNSAYGQVNFLGKPGLLSIPSAEWFEEQPIGLSFAYLPRQYSIFHSPGNRNTVNFYNARVNFTSFFAANLSIAYRPLMADKIGVGDRQLDFRFRLLKEKKYFPAVVLGWTPPGSTSPMMAHDYLVLTKNLNTSFGNFEFSAGYGSPFIFLSKKDADFLDIYIEEKNNFRGSDYLIGFFGGVNYSPFDFGGFLFEYNTETFNSGAYIILWDTITLQAYTLEGKELAFQFAVNLSLDNTPLSLKRYEKNLD